MNTFFEKVKRLAPPGLSNRQISDDLNKFEQELFTRLPWALSLREEEQNDLILLFYEKRNTIQ